MEGPLSLKETLEGIEQFYKENYGQELPATLRAEIINNADEAKTSEDDVTTLDKKIKKFRDDKKVRVIEADVPAGILPPGYSAVLTDVKISTRGPDDLVYRKHPEIRHLIPRGLTLIHINGQEKIFDTIVYANKKFTGGIGDEDNSQPENDDIWREYCIAPPETAEYVISMEKLNGEAAHFSGRYIDGQFYIIAGSKNVHMLVKNKSEIGLYTGERYQVAKVVAATVCEALEDLQPRARHLICSLLHHTKCTVLGEMLQPNNQHIVDLSDLVKTTMKVIILTPTFIDSKASSFTALPPHHALDMMAALGFSCVSYTRISYENVLEQKEKVRKEFYKEGDVMYFINKKDETIGISKLKTCWYVILRALREQAVNTFTPAKKNADWNLGNRIKRAQRRVVELQAFLHFSDSDLKNWQELYGKFFLWLNNEIKSNREQATNIRPNYPIIWNRFLNDTGETDTFIS